MQIALASLPVDSPNGDMPSREVLVIDGKAIERSQIFHNVNTELISAFVRDVEASSKLSGMSFAQLESDFRELELTLEDGIEGFFESVYITLYDYEAYDDPHIIALLTPTLDTWTRPWSFRQYFSVFQTELASRDRQDYVISDLENRLADAESGGVEVIGFPQADVPVSEIIDALIAFVREVHEATERTLAASLKRGSLVTYFEFPPAIKIACEQYLQYFIQFLDDLGIEAESEISSEAGRVLFSVTPVSGEEALSTIKQALAAYLDLPSAPDTGGFDLTADPAATQLRANILHLQGQLMMAQGALQLSQATVRMQATHLSMFQSAQLQTNVPQLRQIEQPHENPRPNSEPLFGETVKVTPLKIKGVEIDLPELLRQLKRKWRGGVE